MGFWDLFKVEKAQEQYVSRLHEKIGQLLPDYDEKDLLKDACISGLLARVAYQDFDVHEGEIEEMEKALGQWTNLGQEEIKAIVKLSLEEIKDLSGIQNHKYCHPLNEILDNEKKFEIIKMLFAVAGGDGTVSEQEAEEIRLITTGLRLEHKHFISAKATVMDKLGALKG